MNTPKAIASARQAIASAIAALEPLKHGNPGVKVNLEQLQTADKQLADNEILGEPAPPAPPAPPISVSPAGPGPDETSPTGAEGEPGDTEEVEEVEEEDPETKVVRKVVRRKPAAKKK